MMAKLLALYHKHRLVSLCALGVIVLVPAGLIIRGRSAQTRYLTAAVTRGAITSTVQATGTINPLTTVPVGSFVSGTVQYIFADFNTVVHAGQVLAQLDPTLYQAQVTTAQGNLDNAKANLQNLLATVNVMNADVEKYKADLAYQQASANRVQSLFQQGVFSQDQYQLQESTLGQSQATLNAGQAQVQQTLAQVQEAKAQIESMQGQLEQAQTNLKYTTIISPIDGTVVARNIDVGQSVAASLQAPNVFTIAQDLTRMQVYASTDESDTGNIHVGTDVTFQVDAFPTQQFHGRISAVRLNAYTVQNVVTYNTIIDFENPNEILLPSETAYVTIPTGHADSAIRIPNAALTYTPGLTNSQLQALYKQYNIPAAATSTHLGGWQVVWKYVPQQTPIPVAVQVGITDYLNTQCLQGNLKEGDVLVTAEQSTGTSSSLAPGLGAQRPGGGGAAAGGGARTGGR